MIAVLSLASPRIMRLKLDPEFFHLYSLDDSTVPRTIEAVAAPRSLYILSGPMRYHYTHEVLGDSKSDLLPDASIDVARRLSIILRDEKVIS
jgi:hypothetical protein